MAYADGTVRHEAWLEVQSLIYLKCNADLAHRSHSRGIVERLARNIAIYPYRCHGCQHRFLGFRYSAREPGPETPGTPEANATRNAIRRRCRRREFLLYGSGLVLFAFFLYFIVRERGAPSDGN